MKQLYYNGKIYLEKKRFASAMLVSGEHIESVGTYHELLMQCPNCECIDLNGKTVIPGFNDSHCHLLDLGESLNQVLLAGSTSVDDIILRGKTFLQTHPNTTFLLGTGWNQDYFTSSNAMPTRADLDKISSDIPIIFSRTCGHICVANSKAIALAHITKDTLAAPGGVIYKDELDIPNGLFSENAMDQINAISPCVTATEMTEYLKTAMTYCAAYGITSAQTCDFKQSNLGSAMKAYETLYQTYPDTLRTYQQAIFNDITAYNDFVKAGNTTGTGNNMYKIGPLKLFVDGSLGARTALMRKPYFDNTSTCGVATMTTQQLDDLIATAIAHRCQVAVHCIGDGAIEMVLDAYDKVITDKNELRHGIVHCQITDNALIKRFAQKDILAYVQPIFIDYDMNVVYERVGKDLANSSYQFGDMYRMGIKTAYGTDTPVEDINPYQNIYCAITRKRLDGSKQYLPEQAVDIYDAIDQYTIGSAYMSFEESEKGRLAPGYLADFLILDQDIFTAAEEEIQHIRPLKTFVGGKEIYCKNSN